MVQKIALGDKAEVSMRTDGVILVQWFPGVSITEQDALDAMAAVDLLGGGGPTLLLVDMSGITDLARDARAVFTRRCSARRIALVGASPVDWVIATFFLVLNVLPCPTRYFTEREMKDAEAWLSAGRKGIGARKKRVSPTPGG